MAPRLPIIHAREDAGYDGFRRETLDLSAKAGTIELQLGAAAGKFHRLRVGSRSAKLQQRSAIDHH